MAHDGQDSVTSNPIVLDDLLTLTGAAVAPAETVLEAAKEAVRAMVVVDGRVYRHLDHEDGLRQDEEDDDLLQPRVVVQ